MPPIAKIALAASLALTMGLCVAFAGLSARHVSFVQDRQLNHRGSFKLSYPGPKSNGEFGYTRKITSVPYLPSDFTMVDTYLMIAAGVVGLLVGAVNLFILARHTDDPLKLAVTGRKVRNLRVPGLRSFAVLQLVLLALLAAATGTAWRLYQPRRSLNLGTLNIVGADDPDTNAYFQVFGKAFSFQSWNCAIAPYVAPDQKDISDDMLQNLCRQAKAVRILLLPALILAALTLGLHLWVWRRHNVAVREETVPPYDEVARKQIDMEAQSERTVSGDTAADDVRSPVSPISPVDANATTAAPPYAAEMSADQQRRAEMSADQQQRAEMSADQLQPAELPMDAAIKEMMGDSGQRKH